MFAWLSLSELRKKAEKVVVNPTTNEIKYLFKTRDGYRVLSVSPTGLIRENDKLIAELQNGGYGSALMMKVKEESEILSLLKNKVWGYIN